MHSIILHHYGLSTFSEKVRAALGLKGLSWRSVDIPPLPPRPLLSPLTGGYRKAPVLQVGADIYCDTNIILPALERLHPARSFYPNGSEGVARGLSFAWDRAMWVPSIGVLVHYIGDMLPAEFVKDRKEGYLGIELTKAAMDPELPLNCQKVSAQYAWLRAALSDGRAFLFGDQPSALDLTCYQTIFLLRENCPPEVMTLLPQLKDFDGWSQRVKALGHGASTPMTEQEAFDVAKAATPAPVTHLDPNGDPGGLRAGTTVRVTPDDNARVPVTGTLVAASDSEIVIHHKDAQAGDLHVHFPRLGFDVEAV